MVSSGPGPTGPCSWVVGSRDTELRLGSQQSGTGNRIPSLPLLPMLLGISSGLGEHNIKILIIQQPQVLLFSIPPYAVFAQPKSLFGMTPT